MSGPDPKGDLSARGLRAKKSWGQNFLKNPQALAGIAAAAAGPGETVLEIGAGLGHLTEALRGRGARVVALERDRDMAEALRQRFSGEAAVEVVEGNALTFDYAAFAAGAGAPDRPSPPALCGNLPYHITSPILFRVLDAIGGFSRVVVMVQREVADRIAAPPGSRVYGALSALVQARAEVARVMNVSRGSFYPAPNVDSAVLKLTARAGVDPAAWGGRYRRAVNAAFRARRKTLKNSLSADFPDAEAALAAAGIDPARRAETLSVEELWRLADALEPK